MFGLQCRQAVGKLCRKRFAGYFPFGIKKIKKTASYSSLELEYLFLKEISIYTTCILGVGLNFSCDCDKTENYIQTRLRVYL